MTKEQAEARADLIAKVRDMLKKCDGRIEAAVDKLQAAGADPIGEHLERIEPGTGNYVIPKCLLCALFAEWGSARGYGPGRSRSYATGQDKEWAKRIRNYEALL